MRIHPQDAPDGARLPAIRTATVTQQAMRPVKVVLSGEVRALVMTLANGLPDVGGISIQDLLTHEDRLVLAWAIELADDAGIDREEVRKLALELGRYRARQLGGAVSKPLAPSASPDSQALLALPTLGAQDERLAREIMISLATRSARLDAGFVRTLVDPDRQAAQPVSVALLHRLVAGPPLSLEVPSEPNVVVARFEARVVLAHTLRALGLPVAGLRVEAPRLRDGATLLRARLPVTGAGPWQLLAQLTRNDRSLLSMLYAGQQARGGDLRAVDQVASALIAMRAAERLLVRGASPARTEAWVRGPVEEPRALPSTRRDPPNETPAHERGHAGETGTHASEPSRPKASGREGVRGVQPSEAHDVEEGRERTVPPRDSSPADSRLSFREPDTRESRAREPDASEPHPREADAHGARTSARAPAARETVVAREAAPRAPHLAAREPPRDSYGGTGDASPHVSPTNEPPARTWHAGASEPPRSGSSGGPLRSDPEPHARLPGAEERAWLLRTAGEQGRLARATKPRASEGARTEPGSASSCTPSTITEPHHHALNARVDPKGDSDVAPLVSTHLAAKVAAAYRSVAPPRMASIPPPGVDRAPDPVSTVSEPSALNVAQALGLGALVERAHVQGLRTRRPFARELDPERRRDRDAPDPERQRARAERRNWQWRRLLQRRARARRSER